MTTENNAPAPSPSPTPELPMAEYAAAIQSGKSPIVEAPAAATTEGESAAATDENSAAATEMTDAEGQNATESATEDDPEKLIEESHPAKRSINKRLSELAKEKKDAIALADQRQAEVDAAKREAEQARAEVERMRAEAVEAANAAKPVVPSMEDDPFPKREDFADPDDYVIAASAHATRTEIRKANAASEAAALARQEEANRSAHEANQKQVMANIEAFNKCFQENQTRVKADYPDYDTKVMNNDKLALSHPLFHAIQSSPDAAHILYHIADNPTIADKLNLLSPLDAAIQIGELQAELRGARKPKVSKAAEPVKPVGSRSSPQPKNPNEMSMEEYADHRKQEEEAAYERTRPKRAGNR